MQKAPEAAIGQITAMAVGMIKEHTLAGRDRRNRKMRKYSKGYAEQQGKKGRSSRVNLFNDGSMFRAMTFKKIGKSKSVIFFSRAEENTKALTHQRGKKGAEHVKAHGRKIKQAFGHPIQPMTVGISAHTRQANTPKREFFGLHKRERQQLTRFLRKRYERAMQ